MTTKYVYSFGNGVAEGRGDMKELLGGKGANLAEMTAIGLPVPAGFTITTEVCTEYYKNDRKYPESLEAEVNQLMDEVGNGGGFILGPCHQLQPDTPIENVLAVYRTVARRRGRSL